MKIFVIYNPVSGLRWIDNASKIKKILLDRKVDYTWFETKPVPHQDFSIFFQEKYDRVLAVGGDGTVREVAQFFIENKILVPLAIIPLGSANVLASTLGIPLFPVVNSLEFALTCFPQTLDAISVNRQYHALICAGQGYDTSLINQTTRKLKKQYGVFAYLISFLRTFFLYFNHRYTIVVDGKRYETVGKIAIVLNGLSVLGIPLDKKISPSDGILDVVVFNPYTLWDIFHALFYSFWRGMRRTPRVQIFSGKEISINQRRGKFIQIDGEVFRAKNLQMRVVPSVINIVYKKKF
jgi:diacylglycerol kinase (ATP)